MKRKEGYILRKLAGEDILIPVGEEIANFNGIIKLNETAKFLWEKLKNDCTKELLIDSLIKEYSIENYIAETDVTDFLKEIANKNMLVE